MLNFVSFSGSSRKGIKCIAENISSSIFSGNINLYTRSRLEDGRIRIGVYRAGGGYLHVFYIGEDYIYEKPHHDYWGDPQFIHNVDPNNPGYGTYWWWENGMKIHVEIGHNLQDGSDSGIWISDNNYNVTIWYRG